MSFRILLALAFVLFASTAAPDSQLAPRGRIHLIVTDTTGSTIPGVAVTIVGKPPTRTVITPADGEVTFAELSQGDYSVKCELSGYLTTTLGPLPIELVQQSPRLPANIRVVMNRGPIWY